MNDVFLSGFIGELQKEAIPLRPQHFQQATGLAAKLVAAIRRAPIKALTVAGAAGAGLAVGASEVKEHAEEKERHRERVRQILMARLGEGHAG